MSSLYVIKGRDQGRRFELEQSVVRLGRDRTNQVRLTDQEASRHHAEIRRENDTYVVIDLDSSNGTSVNDQPVTRHVLQSGDRLQIGRTVLIFTRSSQSDSRDQSHLVSIVESGPQSNESRIVSSISKEEGSQVFGGAVHAETPWLARVRSNLQVMYRTALAVSHTLDIDQLLDRILELIFEWVEADRGCMMLIDQATQQLVPRATLHRKAKRAGEHIEISQTILDYVRQHEEGVLTSDARDDQRWDAGASIVKMGVREAICVPLQGRYGIVGIIYIDTYTAAGPSMSGQSGNRFTDDHLKLMVAIGHQAALAVEDTYYYSGMVQAERLAAVGQTIATLSHHIKNILQGIRGGSYLIEEGLKEKDFEVVSQGWRIVDKNQEKISNLVMDMLSFSKERKPELVSSDLNQIVADVVELMKSRSEQADVQLKWQPDESLGPFAFDPDAIHRAVLNVVTNAIDACHQQEDAAVTISIDHDAHAAIAKVIVRDNGEGIAAEDLKKIFSVFESRKGNRGTGLGLSVSQKILREHSGDIHVSSQLGKGSRFELILPISSPGSLSKTQELI